MKYTDAQIADALKQAEGTINRAAEILGCSRSVINSRAKKSDVIRGLLSHPRGGELGKRLFGDEDIIRALQLSGGRLSLAARRLGCSRRTIQRRADESEAVREAIEEERELFLDKVESKLEKAIDKDKFWAILYSLSTIGKSRGFTRRETPDMNPTIVIELPSEFKWIEKAGDGENVSVPPLLGQWYLVKAMCLENAEIWAVSLIV